MNLLTANDWRSMLSEAIDAAAHTHNYLLTAFVYMPNHVHLLVYPNDEASGIQHLIRAIKRPFALRIKQALQTTRGTLLEHLTIRQRPGIQTFRFWQEGPGYDRNIDDAATALAAIDYIHLNTFRRGLVDRADEWQWSSLRWYQQLPYSQQCRLPALTALPATFLDAGR
jgi:putative transposase